MSNNQGQPVVKKGEASKSKPEPHPKSATDSHTTPKSTAGPSKAEPTVADKIEDELKDLKEFIRRTKKNKIHTDESEWEFVSKNEVKKDLAYDQADQDAREWDSISDENEVKNDVSIQ